MTASSRRIVIALTGASGMVFARSLLRQACASTSVGEVHVVMSDAARRVAADELDATGGVEEITRAWVEGVDVKAELAFHPVRDIGARIASGSFVHHGMVIVPCSTATLGAVAHGAATNLIHRAAEVALKERWPLILMVRESPLSLIHLRNLVAVAEAGAVVMPLMPPWYHRPRTLDDLVDDTVARVLDHLEVPAPGTRRWDGRGGESRT